MFWFFKKKESNDPEAHKKIEHMHSSVTGSFKNIKRDMETINSWLTHLKESDNNQNKRLDNIEKHLILISKKLEAHEQILTSHSVSLETVNLPNESEKEEYEEPEEDSIEVSEISKEQAFIIPQGAAKVDIKSMIESLTDTQKMMFIRLASLQRESGSCVPFKTLAEEIYPGKEYGDVRSTISEYLTLLSEWGLVIKKRTGKQSFVSITPKGEELIQHLNDESKKAQKLTIKKRNK